MIAALNGRVFSIQADRAVIDVVGVGYEVFMATDSVARLPEVGEEVLLHIHTHVREDAITLYGFLEPEAKELFLILKTVSGIGPKLALAMLSGLQVADLCRAIMEGDIKTLTTLQGVGRKTAERVCVDLKEKVGHLVEGKVNFSSVHQPVVPVAGSPVADAISALVNLGYSDPVARETLGSVKKRLGDDFFAELGVEELIREALRTLV
ncbi:Holliday junction branch migration protein RuvA [Desulfomarina sp.]